MISLTDRVVHTLAPYLGQTAARASVQMFLEKSRLQVGTFGTQHLGQLAETLKPGLKVFIGAARAEVVATEILGLRNGG